MKKCAEYMSQPFSPIDKDLLKGLARLDDRIMALKTDHNHQERACESLVEDFF